jgi:hypothetical protein
MPMPPEILAATKHWPASFTLATELTKHTEKMRKIPSPNPRSLPDTRCHEF